MTIVTGGAYQGKLDFAMDIYPDINWVDGNTASEEELLTAEGIKDLHLFIRRLVKEERDVLLFVDTLIWKNPNVVITCDEIGSGIVPMDKTDRTYREMCGRAMQKLCACSFEVYRLVCGIPTRIK